MTSFSSLLPPAGVSFQIAFGSGGYGSDDDDADDDDDDVGLLADFLLSGLAAAASAAAVFVCGISDFVSTGTDDENRSRLVCRTDETAAASDSDDDDDDGGDGGDGDRWTSLTAICRYRRAFSMARFIVGVRRSDIGFGCFGCRVVSRPDPLAALMVLAALSTTDDSFADAVFVSGVVTSIGTATLFCIIFGGKEEVRPNRRTDVRSNDVRRPDDAWRRHLPVFDRHLFGSMVFRWFRYLPGRRIFGRFGRFCFVFRLSAGLDV
jgi:hypothetical protein